LRVLIVKLSSLGDVVHAMPVVHDIKRAFPSAQIDWVVEPGFAPLVRRVQGIGQVIECAQRRWRKAWWTSAVRAEWRAFKAQLTAHRYDAVLDLQGLTKSALLARMAHGTSFGLANRTEGSSFERPARWLIDRPIAIRPHIHALDRSRELASLALNYPLIGPPVFGLRKHEENPLGSAHEKTIVFVHGTSRDDKLWPEADWIELGKRCVASGHAVALPHAGDVELARAQRIAEGIGQHGTGKRAAVWPAMSLDALADRMGATQGVIGVDSGISHLAVALNLPHVQIYNFPTAWRTGPQVTHGHRHQVSIERQPTPEVDLVWAAWHVVRVAGQHQ
jgi:heptosyltransferase-1